MVDNPWNNNWGTREFFLFVYLLRKQESVRLGMYNPYTNEGGTMSKRGTLLQVSNCTEFKRTGIVNGTRS